MKSDKKNKKKATLVFLSLGILALLALGYTIGYPLYQKTQRPPIEEELMGYFEASLSPEAVKLLEGKKAYRARHLTLKGFGKLSDDDLYRWTQLRLAMAREDQILCARMWQGSATQEDLYRGLSKLSAEEVKEWAEVSAKAVHQEAIGKSVEEVLPMEVAGTMNQVGLSLKAKDQMRFQGNLAVMNTLDEKEACWTFKTLMDNLVKEHKKKGQARFMRYLAQRLIFGQ